MKKAQYKPEKTYTYTVFKRNDGDGSYDRIVWEAVRGKIKDDNWRRKVSETATEVFAKNMDEAILKAKQKQGLEALLKSINRKTENGTKQSHNDPA